MYSTVTHYCIGQLGCGEKSFLFLGQFNLLMKSIRWFTPNNCRLTLNVKGDISWITSPETSRSRLFILIKFFNLSFSA